MGCEKWCGIPVATFRRGVLRLAKIEGEAATPPLTPLEVLEGWLVKVGQGALKPMMVNGRFMLSTSESSGSVTFGESEALNVTETIALLESLIEELEGDIKTRPIKRLRQCYNVSVA